MYRIFFTGYCVLRRPSDIYSNEAIAGDEDGQRNMNILQINTSDVKGGAAIAGYRLHSSLRSHGHDSKLIVRTRSIDLPEISQIKRSSLISFIARNSTKLIGLNYAGILGTSSISKHPFFTESHILNFHNLHGYAQTHIFSPLREISIS